MKGLLLGVEVHVIYSGDSGAVESRQATHYANHGPSLLRISYSHRHGCTVPHPVWLSAQRHLISCCHVQCFLANSVESLLRCASAEEQCELEVLRFTSTEYLPLSCAKWARSFRRGPTQQLSSFYHSRGRAVQVLERWHDTFMDGSICVCQCDQCETESPQPLQI